MERETNSGDLEEKAVISELNSVLCLKSVGSELTFNNIQRSIFPYSFSLEVAVRCVNRIRLPLGAS